MNDTLHDDQTIPLIGHFDTHTSPHPLIRILILILILTVLVVYNLKTHLNFLYSYYYSTLCISLLLSPSVLLCGRSH